MIDLMIESIRDVAQSVQTFLALSDDETVVYLFTAVAICLSLLLLSCEVHYEDDTESSAHDDSSDCDEDSQSQDQCDTPNSNDEQFESFDDDGGGDLPLPISASRIVDTQEEWSQGVASRTRSKTPPPRSNESRRAPPLSSSPSGAYQIFVGDRDESDGDRNRNALDSDDEDKDDEADVVPSSAGHRLFMEDRMRTYLEEQVEAEQAHKTRLLMAFRNVVKYLESPLPPFRMIVERLAQRLQIDETEIGWHQPQRSSSRTSPYQERIAESQREALDKAIAAAISSHAE